MDAYDASLTEARRRIVRAIVDRRSGHLCSSLSVLDLALTIIRREWDEEDGCLQADVVLSKGHAAPALYAALSLLDQSLPALSGRLRRLDGPYDGHPTRRLLSHVPVSTGSLGLGLGWAVGRAIGLESAESTRRVYAIVSDGELQCGVSYEALRLAARQKQRLLTVVVDANGWQTDGSMTDDPAALLAALGYDVRVVDGHDHRSIEQGLDLTDDPRPAAVVAATKRCAGLPSHYCAGPEIYGEGITDEQAAELLMVVEGAES